MTNIWKSIGNQLRAQWDICKTISGRRSAQYGIRFSYPVYIFLVTFGIFTQNPYLLAFMAVLAILATVLPMHPFDFVFNLVIGNLLKATKIPGRGSELIVSSRVSLVFNIVVISLIVFGVKINFVALAIIYLLSSTFFIVLTLATNNISMFSIFELFSKKDK